LEIGVVFRKVTVEEGEELARKCGAQFMEVSALAGVNVKRLFHTIASSLPSSDKPVPADAERMVSFIHSFQTTNSANSHNDSLTFSFVSC
jgi:hypothetical protein